MSFDEKVKKDISRRAFFKGSALAAMGVATGGLLAGCGKPAVTQSPAKGATEAPGKASFEIAPPPIADKDIKETVTVDVVVIGAGTAGMTTALTAVEAGAKTIILEKHSSFNARGGWTGAIGTKIQKAKGIEIDKAQVVSELVNYAGNKVNGKLIRLWADKSGEVVDYLINMAEAEGMKVEVWFEPVSYPNGYREYVTGHTFNGPNQANLVGMLEKNFKSKGGEIRYKTPAVQLIREGKGRVTGVIAGTPDNYIKFVAKKAVILCTGDYGHDEEMMKKYCPKGLDVDKNLYTPPVNTGDGHKMGLWIGAAMQEEMPHAPMIHNLGGPPMYSNPFLRVNILGERYENEDVAVPYLCNSIQLQPQNKAWVVFDAKYPEEASKMGDGFGREIKVTEETRKNLQEAIENNLTVTANTIEELAQKLEIPVETFKATVERYNKLAKQGEDLDFGKRHECLTTIEQAPFYAGIVPTALLVTLGGLRTNTNMQVLDTENKLIPGLYAAGNVGGDFYANDYPVIVPGLSHGRCVTFGRIAGQQAAAEHV
ncbi:MAG TPA: FAD-dependent oxidoreductase [Negativicutes bacterium]